MITVRDISKSYDSLKVLSDVNLDINKGEVVSIVGPSGAGEIWRGKLQKVENLEMSTVGRGIWVGPRGKERSSSWVPWG